MLDASLDDRFPRASLITQVDRKLPHLRALLRLYGRDCGARLRQCVNILFLVRTPFFLGYLPATFSCIRIGTPYPRLSPRPLYLSGLSGCLAADIGAAYGTAKSGVGIASMGVMRPDLVMRNIIPVGA